jgi:alpha-D-ribose 1-methylphosphonate 5-phosphate C-P lyase
MLLKHERQTYKVFFKALEEGNLAISQSCMSKLREEPTKSGWRTGAVTVTASAIGFKMKLKYWRNELDPSGRQE